METTTLTDGIQPIHVGIVEEIKSIASGITGMHSFVIKMEHNSKYYFSSKDENTVHKLFEKGKKAAFTSKRKVSKTNNEYFVVDQVFFIG